MIIEWPLNGQFNDAGTDVLTSPTGIREVDADNDDDIQMLVVVVVLVVVIKMTRYNGLSGQGR